MGGRQATRACETKACILFGKSGSVRTIRPADARYAFRKESARDEPILIEDDDDVIEPSRKFYWNPYSGELSMTFPTSNTKSKGGILADAMGESQTPT